MPNETELLAITRRPSVEAALAALARPGLTVAVKRGAAGALAQRGADVVAAPAPVVTPVDTVGAGDSFDAGLIYAHLAGWELERALRFAAVCGALSTRAAGGTAAQATLEEALGVW
jgi:sugar/nucleoside kinase (ribokinase family)